MMLISKDETKKGVKYEPSGGNASGITSQETYQEVLIQVHSTLATFKQMLATMNPTFWSPGSNHFIHHRLRPNRGSMRDFHHSYQSTASNLQQSLKSAHATTETNKNGNGPSQVFGSPLPDSANSPNGTKHPSVSTFPTPPPYSTHERRLIDFFVFFFFRPRLAQADMWKFIDQLGSFPVPAQRRLRLKHESIRTSSISQMLYVRSTNATLPHIP